VTAALSHLDEPEDGRRARRHRSRDLAVDAMLDLLGEGVLRPTAQQVAERAGVSLRSIFRIFDDVESLNAAAAARQLARIRHLFVDVVATGALRDRVDAMVEINTRLYEAIAPVRRAALRAAPESPALQEQLARARGWQRAEVERVFATELATAPGASVAAVELAFSFEAWDQLRSGQGLPVARAAAAVRGTVNALLQG
jgi:TetR/AcrR family transcriptional regulator of autoinduction and epiphytic fitness